MAGGDAKISRGANGQVLLFDGFLRVYDEGRDDEDEDEGPLPQIMAGETRAPKKGAMEPAFKKQADQAGKDEFDLIDSAVSVRPGEGAVISPDGAVLASQSHTQPPPRYTEATLVKRMEELGIGRPSTYASVLTTIVDPQNVRKDKKKLVPED